MRNNIIKKSKLLVITFIFVLVFFAFFTEQSVSVYAEEETKNNKITQQASSENTTIQTLNNVGKYNYSKLSDPKFIIKDAAGTISISEDVVIRFEGKTIVIPNFNYYRIIDINNETRFYQADTVTDNVAYSAFAYIGILLPSIELNSENYVMHLHYGVEETLTLYNVKIVLNELEFTYFDAIAQPLVLGNDDLSQRLKASGKVFQYGAYEEQFDEDETAAQVRAMNSILPNSYDSYTNSDGILHRYVTDYYGTGIKNGKITDDPIVQIVPKSLYFIPGEHFYIGKEDGFFIRVVSDHIRTVDYAVNIFVFDIQNIVPSLPSNPTGSTKIVPLFQYRYRAADKAKLEDSWSNIDPSLTKVIYKHQDYDHAEYYLNSIGFRHSVSNPTLLNPGDEGYYPYEDDGAFIIQTRYNSSGVGLKRKGASFVHDTMVFAFGFIPIISYATNVYSYIYNLHNGFGSDKEYFYNSEAIVIDNEVNIDTFETNNTDQIRERGNLIKSVTATQSDNSENSRLINVDGGYAESKYVVARRSGSEYNKIHVVTSISANILEDNTSRWWLFGWHEEGVTVSYGRATGTYQVSNYQRLEDISISGENYVYIEANEVSKVLKFVPSISGFYRFETSSSDGDPHFHVFDATTKTNNSAIDDLDGEDDRNARLDIYLNASHIYYIEAFNYDPSCSYSLHIGYLPESSLTIARDSNNTFSVDKGTYKMYKFIPTTTGYYDIFTIAQSGNPYLFLFGSSGNKMKENDDGNGDHNSLITYNLVAGQKYYIHVRSYNSNTASYKISVRLSE